MTLTKKHFIAIADVLSKQNIDSEDGCDSEYVDFWELIDDLCVCFQRENSLFDRTKFIEYIHRNYNKVVQSNVMA